MNKLTKKSDMTTEMEGYFDRYNGNVDQLSKAMLSGLLQSKVKFPWLEHCGHLLYKELPEQSQIPFCDALMKSQTIGGDVIVGILLQSRLKQHFDQSFKKATDYISKAISWHVCDTIGARVFGFGLLSNPDKALGQLKQLVHHKIPWVVRATGAGFHFAIKRGLEAAYVRQVFDLLISKALTKVQHEKQGIGWAAKTTAKFHPEVIASYRNVIDNPEQVGQWFRTKVRIGLERNEYVKRNKGKIDSQ